MFTSSIYSLSQIIYNKKGFTFIYFTIQNTQQKKLLLPFITIVIFGFFAEIYKIA